MKLNKAMLFEKLDKLKREGASSFEIKHNSQAVRLCFQRCGHDEYDLIMTTRAIPVRDARKEGTRRENVNAAAAIYQRWLKEWWPYGEDQP